MAKLLVIDDDPVSLTLYSKMLQKAGHSVELAENGERGVALYLTNNHDVVITDILMPQKDGYETIQEITQYNASAKIIAISSGKKGLESSYLKDAKLIGASASLQKPFGMDELVALIDKLLKEPEYQVDSQNHSAPPVFPKTTADSSAVGQTSFREEGVDVFIFDPTPASFKLYQKMLLSHPPFKNLNFAMETELEAALNYIETSMPKAIIMEWVFEKPDTAKNFLIQLKKNPAYKNIPVLVCSKENQKKDIVEAFQHGAKEYIVKPILRNILVHKVEKVLKAYRESNA